MTGIYINTKEIVKTINKRPVKKEVFIVQSNHPEDIKVIKLLKKIHNHLRNNSVITQKIGYTSGGAHNTAKTIKYLIENSDFSYMLDMSKEQINNQLSCELNF